MSDIPVLVERARASFRSDVTRSIEFRRQRLLQFKASIEKHEQEVFDALKADLGKVPHEAYPAELSPVYGEIDHALSNLKSWMSPKSSGLPMKLWPGSGVQMAEPLGTVLIIGPWNYPFQLTLVPLVGAIAAGCTAVVKPSEISARTTAAMAKILEDAFGKDGFVTMVQGGPEASQLLLKERWDLIFFTGSTRVGQIVMEAAAKHLTPVVLELGGKSPCLIDADVDLATTARRLMWGKTYNAGQSCVAPDYALVHREVKDRLIEACKAQVQSFFGADPKTSPDYGRIITAKHCQRLVSLMKGGRVILGGEHDEATRYVAPTLLADVDLRSPLMTEEIFGPLLPLIEVNSMDEAIEFVRARPKPLSLYIFTNSSGTAERVLERTSSGGAIVNDTVVHFVSGLPFGGVGDSGLGCYHGEATFNAFSHFKSVVKKPFMMDVKLRYPPYTASLGLFRKVF